MPAPRSLYPIAGKVRNLRLSKALSQRELARLSGVRAATVNRVEAGLPTRLATIQALALALGVAPLEISRVDA